MEVLRCPSCGTPISSHTEKCEYCFSFQRTGAAESAESKVQKREKVKQKDISESKLQSRVGAGDALLNIAFHRVSESISMGASS